MIFSQDLWDVCALKSMSERKSAMADMARDQCVAALKSDHTVLKV